MNRFILTFLLLACGSAATWAEPISQDKAVALARTFLVKSHPVKEITLSRVPLYGPHLNLYSAPSEQQPFYIFNIGNEQGFVIISGDDAAEPVLGYADVGSIDPNAIPENLQAWLQLNSVYVAQCAQRGLLKTTSGNHHTKGTVIVQPLLGEIQWGQDYPYNSYCPVYSIGGVEKHYYTGCVVTAATQIMAYHCHPQKGKGTKSYQFKGQTLTADFGNTIYEWDRILPSYLDNDMDESQWGPIATLSSHFGIAVEMEYGETASGAHTMFVPGALRDYFGYDKGTTMRKRDYYSTTEWLNLIKDELDAGRPVYYGATSEDRSGGHAFVCDGYDSEGYVHINWGWYGRSNGFFLVNHLSPGELGEGGGTGGYNVDQEIITGIQPEKEADTVFERPLYATVKVSYTDYGDSFSVMTFLSNYDVTPFDGQLAVALLKDNKTIHVLKQEAEQTHINGFAAGKTGFLSLLMRDIQKKAGPSVTDGSYEVGLVFRESQTDSWQLVRTANGIQGKVQAMVAAGKLNLTIDSSPHPNVSVLNPIEPDGEVYAKGSAVFALTLQNQSNNFDLKKLVMRFVSQQNTEVFWDYEYPLQVYNGSTEKVEVLVNLAEDMPAGNYRLLLFEKEHADYTFRQAGEDTAVVHVLPASEVPVLRMTQPIVWMNEKGGTDIAQGCAMLMGVTTRNYGVAGNVSVIVWLENTDHPEQRYLFLQNDVSIKQGELTTVSFYRKLPVDPGTYRIVVSYLTADGQECDDARLEDFSDQMEVLPNPEDTWLEAVSVDMPETMQVGEHYSCKVVLKALTNFSGKIYLRLRQYNLKHGEIAYMNPSLKLTAGEEKELSFTYKPAVGPGRYTLLLEAHEGDRQGTVGAYANCYRLFTVTDNTSGLEKNANRDNGLAIWSDKGALYWWFPNGVNALQIEVYNTDGKHLCSFDTKQKGENHVQVNLTPGIYIVRLVTTQASFKQAVKIN